jgi:uncharacterized protein YndB with AHSA1/START domain
VQVPADRLDYEPAASRAWSATMVLPDGNTIDWTGEFLEVVPDRRLVLTMTDQPDEPSRLAISVEFSPTGSGTHMHLTQEAPDFTDEQRKATIAGWQTFFDVLQQIAETA